MEGFFTSSEVASDEPIRKATGCGACKLYRGCKSPRMPLQGEGRRGIMIVGEAPSASNDDASSLYTGEGTQILARKLKRLGIDLERDCWKTNAIHCHPEKGRTPSALEIECCSPRVWADIHKLKPSLIILLGLAATQSFLVNRWTKDIGSLNKWRGWTIPDRAVKAWVCPTYHPIYVAEQSKNPAVEVIFEADLKQAIECLDKPFPKYLDEAVCVKIVEGQELHGILNNIYEYRLPFSFDYETTGLKPHAPGHAIVSCAIALDDMTCYSFDMPEEGKTRKLFRKIMMAPENKKIAQNMKFETQWSEELLPCPIEGWIWDTMLATHVLDNRDSITSLKFQGYVQFGLLPYDEGIEYYLKGVDDKNSNSLNRIYDAPRKERLVYNGIDAILTWRLALQQMEKLGLAKDTLFF